MVPRKSGLNACRSQRGDMHLNSCGCIHAALTMLPVKGAFALGKKIVIFSFPDVAGPGSHGVWELRCGGVSVWGFCCDGELRSGE